jgi:NAD(P)-dependent dehydrogenase (short-subunit alcohol dehydrogenase family)
MSFADDVVIVTGAGRGLGREYALLFAERGARVVVNDYSPDGGEDVAGQVVAEITSRGGQAVADRHSVATAEGARAIVETALQAFGTVTVLVNNAGIISFGQLDELSEAQWTAMQEVTLSGTWHMCRAVWPVFRRQRYGRIVNTTSNVGFAGIAILPHYGAAKAGVQGLTKCLAQTSLDHGIHVNAIAPMAITRMNRDMFFDGMATGADDWQADIRNGVAPMGPPVAVAPTVLWLAHRSTEINGEIFSTSSGRVARVAFVVGEGYFNPAHGPEDLRDNSDRIRTLGTFLDPRGAEDEIATIPRLFTGA